MIKPALPEVLFMLRLELRVDPWQQKTEAENCDKGHLFTNGEYTIEKFNTNLTQNQRWLVNMENSMDHSTGNTGEKDTNQSTCEFNKELHWRAYKSARALSLALPSMAELSGVGVESESVLY